jgi:hypothetical protein
LLLAREMRPAWIAMLAAALALAAIRGGHAGGATGKRGHAPSYSWVNAQ